MTFKTKYQGNSFEDWFKTNYGTDYKNGDTFARTDSMSDADWAIGQNLYNAYLDQKNLTDQYNTNVDTQNKNYASQADALQQNYNNNVASQNELYANQKTELEKNYNTSLEELDQSKSKSKEQAYITLELLKKYLPQQMRENGLQNSGISNAALVDAFNNYSNNLSSIDANYQTNKASLANNYSTQKGNYDLSNNNAIRDLASAYNSDKSTLEQQNNDILANYKNNYMSDSANISANAGTQSQKLYDQYREEYNTAEKEKAAKAEETQNTNYANAYDIVSMSTLTNEQDMANFIEQFKGNISDSQYQNLLALGQTIVRINSSTDEASTVADIMTVISGLGNASESQLKALVDSYYQKSKISENSYNILLQFVKTVVDSNKRSATATGTNDVEFSD